jgi:hypothetical protein
MNCELGTIGATVYVDQAAGIIESQDFKIIFQYHPLFSTDRDQTLYRKLASARRDISASATGHADAASRPRWAGGERTALINQLRAILPEQGTVIARRRRNLERELDAMLCEENGLTVSQRLLMPIEDMREEWRAIRSQKPPASQGRCFT